MKAHEGPALPTDATCIKAFSKQRIQKKKKMQREERALNVGVEVDIV